MNFFSTPRIFFETFFDAKFIKPFQAEHFRLSLVVVVVVFVDDVVVVNAAGLIVDVAVIVYVHFDPETLF